MPKSKKKAQVDIATQNFYAGQKIVVSHPLFEPLFNEAMIWRDNNHEYPENGLAAVTKKGQILCNPKRRAEPSQWARVIAHCLIHLGMGHFQNKDNPIDWNIACDCVTEKFLTDLRFGTPFYDYELPSGISDEERLYMRVAEDRARYSGYGTAGNIQDMSLSGDERWYGYRSKPQWSKLFAAGLSTAVRNAVSVASGDYENLAGTGHMKSAASRAKQWFISSYPLLGAIAAHFKLIEDIQICHRMQITVAAISPFMSELYINPSRNLSEHENRFVMAHEFLHVALHHGTRQEWRDAFLWNVACDFVINGWLTEMGVGERPNGVLYDEQFKGLNAESIYDRIVTDMRTYRKLATMRGVGLGDIIGDFRNQSADGDLDDFYRRSLVQGLEYHKEQERGYLPAGLVEEIRALGHPPIPWDVELARWFDEQFTPIEKKRSYARPSRRQSSTPNIPRPSWVLSQAALDGRTFGVILDTSGSMDRALLASALGAIASYSYSRDVYAARVIFCDAQAHDAGFMKPEDIAGTVKVRGRGGTVLQPGVDMLTQTEDFPKDAPILVITDGECDKVILYGREHAFLVPQGARLPFVAKGKVFRMK